MKKILQGIILWFLMIVPLENFAAGEIIANWNFNSTANKTIADAGGKHNAVIAEGSQAELCASPDDKAVLFNGGNTSVQTKHADDLSLEDDFTIKCIIKPTMLKDFRTILFKGYRKAKPELINYCFDARDGKIELKTKTADNEWHAWTSDPLLKENEWFWIVLSYKNNIVKLWVNGVECKVAQAKPVPDGKLIKNSYPLHIGHALDSFNAQSYPFVGLIDDIKIISGAMDSIPQSEIDEWNKRMNDYTQREIAEKVKKVAFKIEKFGAQTAMPAGAINEVKNKLLKIAALPADKTEAGFAAFDRELNDLLYKSYYNKYCSSPDGFVIAALSTARRIERRPDFVTLLPPATGEIQLQAAGNEYEGFQALLIANPDKNVDNVAVKVSDLTHVSGKHVINSRQVTFGRIQDIVSTPPDIPVDFTGAFPDMIEDGVAPQIIPKADFVPVYFRVFVPAGTPAGIYKGRISFSGNGIEKTVELQLQVFDFTLPVRSSLKVAFSFFEKNYADWYGYKGLSEKQRMYIYDFLLSYGISPNNIYHTNGSYPAQEYLEKLKDRINFLTFSADGPAKPVSAEELEKVIEPKVAAYEKIKSAGLEKYAYYYAYDEISANMKYLPAAKQMLPAMRKKIPGLKAMQTSFPIPEIRDLYNAWCPLFYHFGDKEELKTLQDLKQRGDEIWWYAADSPSKPYPNFFLDYPVFDCRIIATLSFMYKIDGVLYWCINREWSTNLDIKDQWPQKPWKAYIVNIFTQKRVSKNGMGNLVYPGPDGRIYPSLRLENLRDGVADYEYLTMFKNSIEALNKSKYQDKQTLLDKASALLVIPANVAVAVNNYSGDPDNLLKYRIKVAEMIEEINAALAKN